MATPAPKPQDQPDPDAALLQGGPGAVAPAAPAVSKPDAPAPVAVKYGGKEYNAPPELAAAWEAREREFGQKLSEHSGELGELRKWKQSVTQTVTPQREVPSLGTQLFENPDAALGRFREEIKAELRQEYGTVAADEKAWAFIVKHNPDLEDERDYVEKVFRQSGSSLTGLAPLEAAKKLGDLTRMELLRVVRKFKTGDGEGEELPQGRAIVEGASSPAPKGTPAESEIPKTLSEIIRERRARRLSATASPKG